MVIHNQESIIVELKRRVIVGEYTDMLPTSMELAEEFQVNVKTMSKALNRLTAAGVLKRRRRLGTMVRKEWRENSGNNRLIETVFSDFTVPPSQSEGEREALSATDRQVPLIALVTHEYPTPWVPLLINNLTKLSQNGARFQFVKLVYHYGLGSFKNLKLDGFDGALLAPTAAPISKDEMRWLCDQEIPVVVLFKHLEELPLSSVVINDYAVGIGAAQHLLALQHRKLAVILCEPMLYGSMAKINAYKLFAEHMGASVEFIDCQMEPGEYPSEKAHSTLTARLKGKECDFTGLFVIDDFAVPGILTALKAQGLQVPQDVSIVGCDGLLEGAYYDPPLTTMAANADYFIETAVSNLLSLIKHEKGQIHSEIIPSLLVRESTCRCRETLIHGEGQR